jgi:hypothetical protein
MNAARQRRRPIIHTGRERNTKRVAVIALQVECLTAANNGATVAELEAIFGWQGGRMAALYTRAADRRRLAMAAMTKLDGERTAIPSPEDKVRDRDEKA